MPTESRPHRQHQQEKYPPISVASALIIDGITPTYSTVFSSVRRRCKHFQLRPASLWCSSSGKQHLPPGLSRPTSLVNSEGNDNGHFLRFSLVFSATHKYVPCRILCLPVPVCVRFNRSFNALRIFFHTVRHIEGLTVDPRVLLICAKLRKRLWHLPRVPERCQARPSTEHTIASKQRDTALRQQPLCSVFSTFDTSQALLHVHRKPPAPRATQKCAST